jgi:protein-tyrosine sulfotransferase
MYTLNLGIIGGCGSSGTTLLTHLLSRHPEICSGPEFNCFNHKELYCYSDLSTKYSRMFNGKASPSGYFATHWFLTEPAYYGVTLDILDQWIKNSSDTSSFIEKVVDHVRKRFNSRFFIEKTPSNVYCFRNLAQTFPDVPIIHIIRDGRDVVCSLMKRGYSLFSAGSRWLYDTLCGIMLKGFDNYIEIKYEDLVSEPIATLKLLLRHLKIPSSSEILENNLKSSDHGWHIDHFSTTHETAKAWRHKPSDPIQTSSIGRYKTELKSAELAVLYKICLSQSASTDLGINKFSFGDLLERLDYAANDFDAEGRLGSVVKNKFMEIQDYYRRIRMNWYVGYIGLPRIYTHIR